MIRYSKPLPLYTTVVRLSWAINYRLIFFVDHFNGIREVFLGYKNLIYMF